MSVSLLPSISGNMEKEVQASQKLKAILKKDLGKCCQGA
jgi:hypothetical protein